MDIIAIPREAIGFMFPAVGPHLLRGLTGATDQTVEGVLDALVDGTAQLWAAVGDDRIKGAFLTSIVEDDDEKTAVDVYALGGEELAKWGGELSDTMAAFAKHNGAHRVIFVGRKALSKLYRDVRIVGEHSPGVFKFERTVQ
jgi:hypothetical protein